MIPTTTTPAQRKRLNELFIGLSAIPPPADFNPGSWLTCMIGQAANNGFLGFYKTLTPGSVSAVRHKYYDESLPKFELVRILFGADASCNLFNNTKINTNINADSHSLWEDALLKFETFLHERNLFDFPKKTKAPPKKVNAEPDVALIDVKTGIGIMLKVYDESAFRKLLTDNPHLKAQKSVVKLVDY